MATAYSSLRDFIDMLESAGRLVRVSEPVSIVHEMTEIQTRLLADPGRAYRPEDGLAEIARYEVPTSREIEDSDVKSAVIWRVEP